MKQRKIEENRALGDQSPASFRLQGVDQLPVMAQEEVCPIFTQYFDYLEHALTDPNGQVDIGLLQEMLQEVSQLLRSGKGQLRQDGYLRMLDRLTTIYTKGLQAEDDRAFAGTAAYYADILETVSHHYQDYDYRQSVSLLTHYLDKLYHSREGSWLDVYDHLHSMPDSILVMQQLRVDHLNDINGWIEEGVDNLFTLWDEQLEVIRNQDSLLTDLGGQICNRQTRLRAGIENRQSNVIDFKLALEKRMLRQLRTQRDQLMYERAAKRDIADLLEENIREFSDRLAKMRRSTLIRLVWDNPLHS